MSVPITAGERQIFRYMASERVSQRAFFGISTLLLVISVVVTIVWCGSMSVMGEMPMPGGWTMSMAWMRMPGQTWFGAGASFLGMWVVMMVAMMLPCLIPTLSRYRQAVAGQGEKRPGWLTTLLGAGYFFVWTVSGIVIFPVGVALAELEMQSSDLSRAVPSVSAVIVVIAGAFQFTRWKTNHLACCRDTPERRCGLQSGRGAAWRQGVRLGISCCYCCAGLMTILLVLGVMDLRTMAFVTVAITAERVAPAGEIVARVIGAAVIALGFFLVARAAGLC
jgi:predicted metal-binding membrane protein